MNLSRQMHGRQAAMIMMAVAAFYVILVSGVDEGLPPQGEQGLCLPPPALWQIPQWIDVSCGIILNGLLMLLMALINKSFNVLRSVTRLHLGLFALMSAAVPRLILNVNSGVILALAINLCVFLLFGSYDNPRNERRVFLSFLILSMGAAMQYCFVIFIPVMWILTAQMRIFNVRTIIASILGIATPWVILLGFSIVTPEEIHLPGVISIFDSIREKPAIYLLCVTGFTAFLLIGATILNISKTIAYNAVSRAYNGALTVIAIITIIAITLNYNNLLAYLPLLNVCAAYQLTHWFVNHHFERQYIAVITVATIYIAFYIWRITL